MALFATVHSGNRFILRSGGSFSRAKSSQPEPDGSAHRFFSSL